eukprot:294203-Pyramimonas_sp.AAC.1
MGAIVISAHTLEAKASFPPGGGRRYQITPPSGPSHFGYVKVPTCLERIQVDGRRGPRTTAAAAAWRREFSSLSP